jgi:drug/metabolite transporter (DMT)-like permease
VNAVDLRDDRRPLVGIVLKICSVVAFVVMSALIKAAGDVFTGQVVFFRSLFAVIPVVAVMAWRRELATAFYTSRPMSHVLRGLVGVSSMGLGFFALTRLPLPEWIAINYAQPLIVVVFSAIFLGETVRFFRWTAVAVGFVGVVIISWPKLTLLSSGAELGHGEAIGVVAVLAGAAISAVAMLLVRGLVRTEASATIVFWFSITCTVAGLATLPFGWSPLTVMQAAILIGAGLCGGVGQILMTESYRHADMSTIAPFEYSSMILGIAIGYFAFAEVPTLYTLVGGIIVVGAGLFIIWREQRLGLPRGAARKVTPPQG